MRKSQIAIRIVSIVCAVLPWSAVARAQAIDPAFTPPATLVIDDMAVQPDGKVLVSVIHPGDLTTGTIVRLNASGSIDTSFTSPIYNHYVSDLAVQPDGKVIIGGSFSTFYDDAGGTTPRNHIARLNADGSLDMTFNPGADNTVLQLSPQPDGKILVGGQFSVLAGAPRNHAGRLNADGTIDAGFNPVVVGGSFVDELVQQPDGKILVAGDFSTLGGVWRSRIGRLNADGSLDTVFDLRMSGGSVYTMAVQPDGRILLGGDFTGFNPPGYDFTTRNRLARLNADGSVDTSFDPGSNGSVSTVALQPDGKILVGGHFTALGGGGTGTKTRNRIGRLNSDGSLDTAFNPGANASVHRLVVQADGRILVEGDFTTLGGGGTGTTARNRIGRLVSATCVAPLVTMHPSDQAVPARSTATFTATATGSPAPTVQWQQRDPWTTWSDIAGATAATYEYVVRFGEGPGHQFRAVFANMADQVETNAATLTIPIVPLPPVVTYHPQAVTLRAGSGHQFYAEANGYPAPTVQWQMSPDGGVTWSNLEGQTFGSPTIRVTAAFHGNLLRALFTNPSGQAATNAVTLTVRSVSGSDFDGNATTDIAVYRRTTGFWYVRNQLAVQYGGPGYIPVPGDYDGNGTTDIAVYRPSTGMWFVRGQFSVRFGSAGDVPVPGDYNGDGKTDIAIFRPSTGEWFIRNYLYVQFGGEGVVPVAADYDGNGTTDIAVWDPKGGYWSVRGSGWYQFGEPGDIPVPGRYLPGGTSTGCKYAVYRPTTGMWYLSDGYSYRFNTEFGRPGDLPVARDYDGDGVTDIAVYRPSSGRWFVRDQFTLQFGDPMDVPVPPRPWPLSTADGDYNADRAADVAVFTAATGRWRVRNIADFIFGEPADTPVSADYDGDGSIDMAVWRPSTATWYALDFHLLTVVLGNPDDTPVPGDYNGDGRAEPAVYRPTTGDWYVLNRPVVHFGDTGDIPMPGDYNGDGKTEIAVYRPSTGYWYVRNQMAVQLGGPGWVPVPGDYNGDGIMDFGVFETATGRWNVPGQFSGVFGADTDTPVPADYDGDGTTDVAVFRSSTATWYVRNQFTVVFGDPGDVPVVRIGGIP